MLTPPQLQHFARDGYLVLPGFTPAGDVAAACQRAQAIVDAFKPTPATSRFSTRERGLLADAALLASAEEVHCFFEEEALDDAGCLQVPKSRSINKIGHALHERDPFFIGFSHGRALAGVAASLGLLQPQVWQSQLIFKQPGIGGEVGWHQDASFFATAPHSVLTFWFALQDASVDNGCLWVQPGGQRGPLREQYLCEGGRLRMAQLDATPWPRLDDAVALAVPVGTLVLLHGLLPHRSAANRSPRPRLAYTLHVTDGRAVYAPTNWLQRSPALPVRGLD